MFKHKEFKQINDKPYFLSQHISVLRQCSVIDDSPLVFGFFEMGVWVKKKHLVYLKEIKILVQQLSYYDLNQLTWPFLKKFGKYLIALVLIHAILL